MNKKVGNSKEGSKSMIKVDDKKVEEAVEKRNEWPEVTPGKASRSPGRRKLVFGSVTLLTNFRFSVLMPFVEQEEEALEQQDIEEQSEEQSEEDILKETDEEIPRRILPRESKLNHRYLKVKTSQKAMEADPSYLNKKKPRRQ